MNIPELLKVASLHPETAYFFTCNPWLLINWLFIFLKYIFIRNSFKKFMHHQKAKPPNPEEYSEPRQISKMEVFMKTVNG